MNHIVTYFERLTESPGNIATDVAIPMIIAIFVFAFPLLLQTTSRIDEKYSSTSLAEVFRLEPISRILGYTLGATLIGLLLWSLKIPRFGHYGEICNSFIDNSALVLLCISTVALVTVVIMQVNLTYIYYNPERLLKHLKKKYYSANSNDDKQTYFEAISKILFYSLRQEGEPLSRDLQSFYEEAIRIYREKKGQKDTKIEYPPYFYNVLFDANERLCKREEKTISYYSDNPIYRWFIDQYQGTIIGEATFKFLWRCLCQAILYGKDEFITSYWSTAHQYIEIYLQDIRAEYDDSNEAELKARVEARERFLEFHYALGGFLLMQGKLSLLAKLMAYSNSFPPRYVLVPEAMEEVISRFMSIEREENHANFMYYTINYSFPGIDGVNSDEIIKRWIKRYFAILFLRQYTLPEIYSHSNRLSTPTPPDKLREIRKWIDELEFLAKDTQEYLENEEYLKALNLGVLVTGGYFDDSNRPSPENLIDGFKQSLETEYKNIKINQPLAEEKLNQFNSQTKERLVRCFEEYEALKECDASKLPSPRKAISFEGKSQIQDKMAFASNQDISYANWDSILAEAIAREFQYNMPRIFGKFSERLPYKVKGENILPAIQRLNLSEKKHTIVSVGIDLSLYRDLYNWEDVSDRGNSWSYKGIPIISLNGTPISHLNSSFFIMRNEDLPSIIYRKPDDNTIQRYKLKEIDREYHIYTNVLDLKEEREIKEDIHGYTDLDKSVLVYVALGAEISCIVDAKCIQLQVFSLFDDTGNPDDLASIKNIL